MAERRALLAALVSTGLPVRATPPQQGRLVGASVDASALPMPLNYTVYLPAGYAASSQRLPVVYLLHGRGDSMSDWWRCKPLLDALIAARRLPPLLAVMPDAPWSRRGGYYVDSAHRDGAAVETAFINELLPHVDARWRALPERGARLLAGYSMGGAGALRLALAHPQLFDAAVLLSPAVYTPLPPKGSSVREFGGFGRDDEAFVAEIYQASNYPALLAARDAASPPQRFFVVSGDDEYRHPDPADAEHDIDLEAHLLYKRLLRAPGLRAELRIVDGGHDWDVWLPALRDGLLWWNNTKTAV